MIITCPNCKKQFKIDDSKIPQKGRNLQCGSCEHVWFYKIKDESLTPLTLNENFSSNEAETRIVEDKIPDEVKVEQLITANKFEKKEKKLKKSLEKQKSVTIQKKNVNKNSYFFSNLIVIIISFLALIILFDTFQKPLINIFPELEFILLSLYETLQDIKLFIIDLFQ